LNASINKTLGLPLDYSVGFNDAMTILEKFKEAMPFGNDNITNISFIYYSDKFGDFMKPKTHIDAIVKKMFSNINTDDQFMILTYLNEKG